MRLRHSHSLFIVFSLGEGGLIPLAMAAGWLWGLDPWKTWKWGLRGVGAGVAGAAPLVVLLMVLLRSHWSAVADLRRRVEDLLAGALASWRLWQFGVVSLLAGVGEEALFRGVIQAGLAGRYGDWVGWVVSALLFGMLHALSGLYFLFATVVGLWLGILWWWSGDLVVPVVVHALYDFIALLALRGDLAARSRGVK